MAINNTLTLTGNMGIEARIIEREDETRFAGFTLATTDSYKVEATGEWKEKETIWHDVLVFSPSVLEIAKQLKVGTRITVTGSLSYRPFQLVDGDGEVITKKEAVIIARRIDMAPLPKKAKPQVQPA